MQRLKTAKKTIQKLTYYVCAVSMFILIPMMFITTFDVIGRSFFSWSIAGTIELSRYMLAIVILLGLAYTQQVKGHPRVTVLASKFPLKAQLIIEILMNLLGMFIVAIFVWQGWVLAHGRAAAIVSDVLRISQYPFRLLVSAGGALLFLELLVDLITAAGRLLEREPAKTRPNETFTRAD